LRYLLFLLFVLLLLSGGLYGLYYLMSLPREVSPPKVLEIKYGTPVPKIAEKLEREGVVRSKYLFLLLHAFKRQKLEAGEYEFKGKVNLFEVYRTLAEGRYKLYRVLVKEGADLFEIAKELERAGVCKGEDFLRYAFSEEVVRKYDLTTPSMEGFLFPDTYYFSKNTHPLKVIEVMYGNFLKKTKAFREELKKKGLEPEVWVTVASMVEKETRYDPEKPLIAAVIYNRLKKGMKLQIDPTVIYAAKLKGLWKGKLLKKFYALDSPYNTYLYFGLPPGPISNPGLSSLKAALRPAKVKYLYFVADKEGKKHLFAETYEEHLKNIKEAGRDK